MRRIPNIWLLLLAPCILTSADDAGWQNKPIAQWDQKDAQQVLTDSPWAKSVAPQWVRDLSPDERRMGQDLQAGEKRRRAGGGRSEFWTRPGGRSHRTCPRKARSRKSFGALGKRQSSARRRAEAGRRRRPRDRQRLLRDCRVRYPYPQTVEHRERAERDRVPEGATIKRISNRRAW